MQQHVNVVTGWFATSEGELIQGEFAPASYKGMFKWIKLTTGMEFYRDGETSFAHDPAIPVFYATEAEAIVGAIRVFEEQIAPLRQACARLRRRAATLARGE